jgi:hypothetical protein
MTDLLPLWLPILLSAAAVWIFSILAWVALPHHKYDFIRLPDPPDAGNKTGAGEDAFMTYLRATAIKPGNYTFPDARGRAAMNSENVQKAWQEGPVGHLSVWKTPLTMGDKLIATFAVFLLATTLIAYLTRLALPSPPGPTAPPFAQVFQFATIAGILAYCFSFIPNAVWWGSYKRTIAANIIDGVAYAVITGAIFAWRWPR